MATGFVPATDRQRAYLNDLAVRVNQTIAALMDQYGTYTRVGSTKRLSKRDASRLISILEERLTGRGARRSRGSEFTRDLPAHHPGGRLRKRKTSKPGPVGTGQKHPYWWRFGEFVGNDIAGPLGAGAVIALEAHRNTAHRHSHARKRK